MNDYCLQKILICCLLFCPYNFASAQPPTQTTNQDFTVKLYVKVTDNKGRFIQGLSKENFSIAENKTNQNILSFAVDDDPTSYVILFDVSGSMRVEKLNILVNSFRRFHEEDNKNNEYMVIGFTKNARVIEWGDDYNALTKSLSDLANQTRRATALYDACLLGIEELQNANYNKKVLLIISDGYDTASTHFAKEVIDKLKSSNIAAYSLNVITDDNFASSQRLGQDLEMLGQDFLKEVSRLSGGEASFPSTSVGVDAFFSRINSANASQYLITFTPANLVTDGKWHKIKIKVTKPDGFKGDLNIKAREGYLAPSQNK